MGYVDALDREEFINQLINIVERISGQNRGGTFAINGDWGIGKTFLLNMFQEEIKQIQSEETGKEKYLVLHYNCWEHDYYDEPLLAILSILLNQLQDHISLLSTEAKEKLTELVQVAKIFTSQVIKLASGFELNKLLSDAKSKNPNNTNEVLDDKLGEVRKVVKKITEDTHIVLIIDELDRCIPNYAIKVLERLHHLFNETNMIAIISVDSKQLNNSIKEIYGDDVNLEEYLKKFIEFSITLNTGTVKFQTLLSQYSDYLNCFEKDMETLEDVYEFLVDFAGKLNIRTLERIIDKAYTLHLLSIESLDVKLSLYLLGSELAYLMYITNAKDFSVDYLYSGYDVKNTEIYKKNILKIFKSKYETQKVTVGRTSHTRYFLRQNSHGYFFAYNAIIEERDLLYTFNGGEMMRDISKSSEIEILKNFYQMAKFID